MWDDKEAWTYLIVNCTTWGKISTRQFLFLGWILLGQILFQRWNFVLRGNEKKNFARVRATDLILRLWFSARIIKMLTQAQMHHHRTAVHHIQAHAGPTKKRLLPLHWWSGFLWAYWIWYNYIGWWFYEVVWGGGIQGGTRGGNISYDFLILLHIVHRVYWWHIFLVMSFSKFWC